MNVREPLAEVACGGFGGIDGAVLPACASESDLQVGKTALQKTLYVVVNEAIDTLQEGQYLAVLLGECLSPH